MAYRSTWSPSPNATTEAKRRGDPCGSLGVVAGQGRWRWDLNPRTACTVTRFRGVRPRPLGDSTSALGRVPDRVAGRARLPALAGEEGSHQGGTLLGEHAADDLRAVVQPAVAHHVPQRADGAGLGVGRAVDEAVHPGQHEGAGAHGARLEGDDQGAT